MIRKTTMIRPNTLNKVVSIALWFLNNEKRKRGFKMVTGQKLDLYGIQES